MQQRRGKRAAALAFAVVAGTLGAAPAALAAPPTPGTATTTPDSAGADVSVWPRPQSLRPNGTPVAVTDEVALVTGATADRYAVEALRTLLLEAGARRVTVLTTGDTPPAGALVVRAETEQARGDVNHDLPSGGYRLTVGDGRVTLSGAGEDGLFHAVQTLRHLVRKDGTIAAVAVRDWPGTAVRGTTEGFYGTPWTHEQRLEQLDFMGRTKQNRYLYAPGDDLYRQARWREPYPAGQRARFRELAERARRNHVTLAWAVTPGQAMCFASDADVRALTRKLDAMWALGFRAFQLQFQDVSYSEWHCDADAERFGSGPEAAARAQARVANAVARHLAERHRRSAALSLMPTEYYEDGPTDYRRALTHALDERVEVAWTGIGVVPRTITGRELAATRSVFGEHPLVTMDNYPVNDYAPGRIFLGPYQGRDPAVATGSAALLANAMEQAEASRIPLFTAADYAWNPRAYRPQESWQAAIDDLAAGDARREQALTALAGNDASSVLDRDESAYLRPLIEAFWNTRGSTDQTAARRLREAFTVMRELPERLGRSRLGTEVAPWSEQLARYGEAGTAALDMLRAQGAGDPAGAWTAYRNLGRLRDRLAQARVTVGTGVLDPFLSRAQKAYAAWAGLDHEPSVSLGDASDGRMVRLPDTRALSSVTVLAEPGTSGDVEVHVPGRGWERIGSLDASGATEVTARRSTESGATGVAPRPPLTPGLRVDALRVTGPAASRVRHLVPWFADSTDASLELTRARADIDIGGTQRLTARLGSLRPADVRGRLTAEAPEGVRVRVPAAPLTLPRGTTVEVPVEVTVAPGTPSRSYEIRLAFGGTTRTLTVRAFPRTAGPDLARTGTARSSGDETPDFPASAANDGDPRTRWSSPVDDGAWWQVRLADPVRLGQVVLHWQDAHPSAYRVQVSADGRRWRTAATVRDGRGGRETVRMDERDVRFVRVQGQKRATPYGYSLWSVEAYAVAE
ncbi:beta-N-acetylglucosaminidase domain-containing protein [Streptomyces sp. S.PNR 29]|uniref:beta-N-acetylglucosaminidase domain-containing protein n=1 Tax=Streptomyces sp. S.PNR 29 TaxID=2973805 RepID=UPI0025B108AA|nr:beta-N-acetylglucosaminidase domain-containing protein [Streptomyces sp. S.PNR 29]MDN0196876.1 beta-N-acetylglucosaminidase domain-containing protein [Streptomyces sp. S.PNR 29]